MYFTLFSFCTKTSKSGVYFTFSAYLNMAYPHLKCPRATCGYISVSRNILHTRELVVKPFSAFKN